MRKQRGIQRSETVELQGHSGVRSNVLYLPPKQITEI